MKKAITVLWTIFILCMVVFVVSFFVVESTVGMWRVFAIVMPIIGISFWGAIVLSALEHWKSRKK